MRLLWCIYCFLASFNMVNSLVLFVGLLFFPPSGHDGLSCSLRVIRDDHKAQSPSFQYTVFQCSVSDLRENGHVASCVSFGY